MKGFLDEQFNQLQQLQDESNPDFVVEVVSLFFEDSDRLLNELAKALLVLNIPSFNNFSFLSWFFLRKSFWVWFLLCKLGVKAVVFLFFFFFFSSYLENSRLLIIKRWMPMFTSWRVAAPGNSWIPYFFPFMLHLLGWKSFPENS